MMTEQQTGEQPIDLGADDGYVNVTVAGATVKLDVYAVNNQIHAYHQANKGKPDHDYNEGLVGLMTGLGLPACSQRMAVRFVQAIRGAVEGLRKKG